MTIIQNAALDWIEQDGVDIPVSTQFGDVYFSRANGLAETRHVFINGNDLPQRLSQLKPFQYFCVGETGFGSGLNVLALWQLWNQVKPDNHSRLHLVTVEKFPLSRKDLQRALQAWPELAELSAQLIAQYPPAIAGCHRLIFANDRFSFDLWLGDAADCLPKMQTGHAVDAWFLDGFAPKCNPELWQDNILSHIIRLSAPGTTFASFSVAGIVKSGLRVHGIKVSRPKGFGHKREMLKAIWPIPAQTETATPVSEPAPTSTSAPTVAVIGAGIAGLSVAHVLANRGIQVTLVDSAAPLAGASGNPRALLTPKLVNADKIADSLLSSGAMLSYRYWRQYPAIMQPCPVLAMQDDASKIPAGLAHYPADFLQQLDAQQASALANTALHQQASLLQQTGLIHTQALAQQVLTSPHIQFKQACIQQLVQLENHSWQLLDEQQQQIVSADHVVICAALASTQLHAGIPALKPIRGQVSWCDMPQAALQCTMSYGGYAAPLQDEGDVRKPQLLFGASFIRANDSTDVTLADHQHNYQLMLDNAPQLARQLPDIHSWQGRASTRAQSNDYLPLAGAVDKNSPHLWTLCGLGSKGYSYALLCAELLAAHMLCEMYPLSATVVASLNPARFIKSVKAKKPYQQG